MKPVQVIVRQLLKWFDAHARDLPWRRHSDPYGIWVSEIMLQQTQVKTVVPYWEHWMRRFPTVQTLANAPVDAVLKQWEGLGYYSRARNLHRAAQLIVSEHRGRFPATREAVLGLPGVGRYTAGAVCSIAFNQPTPILDGNIIRLLSRLHALPGNPRIGSVNAKLWQLAEEMVRVAGHHPHQTNACSRLNQSMMELGALVCVPRDPLCHECPLKRSCAARALGRTTDFPNVAQRPTPTTKRNLAFIIRHDDRWLVRQRSSTGINAGLWEFPNAEASSEANRPSLTARHCLGFSPASLTLLTTLRHTITRYRITLQVFLGHVTKPQASAGRWFTLSELDGLAFPSAHRQILTRLRTLSLAAAEDGRWRPHMTRGANIPQRPIKSRKKEKAGFGGTHGVQAPKPAHLQH